MAASGGSAVPQLQTCALTWYPSTLPAAADGRLPYADAATAQQVATLEAHCATFGIELHGFGSIETRSVDVHVGRLRGKLGTAGEQIETVVGLGYRFVE